MLENLSEIQIGESLKKFKDGFLKSERYWIIYLILVVIVSLVAFNVINYKFPFKEIIGISIVAIFGIIAISFYSSHDSNEELYKTAFVIIILFGLLCCFINPICNVSDETEHLARADLTSQGILFPEYINESYMVSDEISSFFIVEKSHTVFEVTGDTEPINTTLAPFSSAFQQNPFFGYIPQGIGVAIAKLLNLNTIWMLWLARVFNLLWYASLISYAVKKTPILKIPTIAMACIPVAIQQGASASIDATFIGLGIVTIAYFFYMLKSEDGTIENKEILIFSLLSLLLGMTKLPFLAIILLLVCVPESKFKESNYRAFIILGVLAVIILGLIWTSYSMPNYLHSWRAGHNAKGNIDSKKQIMFMIAHPLQGLISIFHIPNSLGKKPVLTALATIYTTSGKTRLLDNGFLNPVVLMFFGALTFFYPNTDDTEIKQRVGPLITGVIIYAGVCLTQIISWAPIGKLNHLVVHTRYFLPLFVLLPFVFGMNHVEKRDYNVDSYVIMLTVGFVSAFLIKMIATFY